MSNEKLIQHYQVKVEMLENLQNLQKQSSQPKSEQIQFCYGVVEIKDIKYSILIEFDKNNPAFGIYYGCKVPCDNSVTVNKIDKQWEGIVKQIKNDFGMQWNDFGKAYSRILSCEHEDRKHYWPCWIRLNDDEDIYEAVKGVQIIIQSLLCQGFCIYPK